MVRVGISLLVLFLASVPADVCETVFGAVQVVTHEALCAQQELLWW
jgi:hypothetical protein